MKTTDLIRAWMQNLNGTFRSADVLKALPDVDSVKVRHGIDHLIELQEIETVERGKYRARGTIELKKMGKIKSRIFRAMYIKGVFSVSEIVGLTDGNKSGIMKLIRQIADCGQVDECGRRKKHSGHFERVFRIRNRDEFYLKHILNDTKL